MEDASEYRIVVGVYRDDDKIVQVGGRFKGPSKFIEAFPTLYSRIDEQLMKVVDLADIIDSDPPMQDEATQTVGLDPSDVPHEFVKNPNPLLTNLVCLTCGKARGYPIHLDKEKV